MNKHLILTIISDDRPGVIKEVADTVSLHQGNWLESRLTQLAGKFAGVVRIRIEHEAIDALQVALAGLMQHGIRVTVDTLEDIAAPTTHRSATFTAVGPDRRGIVREIAQAFAQYDINIAELDTRCSSMPYSGEPLFEAEGSINLPDQIDWDQLSEQLDSIANALGIDIELEPDAQP